jgi:hypothetical protein
LSELTICKNCGFSFTGNYCSNCGEKVYHDHDKSLHHLLHEVVHFITHFDGAFFKTIKSVFIRPGLLSSEYVSGIRKKYFKPVSLYLLCVVIYLLFPLFRGLNMEFYSYTNKNSEYQRITMPAAKQKAISKNLSFELLAKKYDEKSAKISKVLLLLYLPLTALVLFALYFKQRKYFFDHFILSAELNSFLVAFGFLILPLLLYLIEGLGHFISNDFHLPINNATVELTIGAGFLFSIVSAMKRFYNQNWLWTVLKSLLFLAIFLIIIIPLYRIILFFTTMIFI